MTDAGRRQQLLTLALLGALAACPAGTALVGCTLPPLIVIDRAGVIPGAEAITMEFVLDDDRYIRDKHYVMVEDLVKLREKIIKAPRIPDNVLDLAGITSGYLIEHHDEILILSLYEHWRKPDGSVPKLPAASNKALDPKLLWEHLQQAATSEIEGKPASAKQFKLILPGEPQIEIWSDNNRPWMLPWTVSDGSETFQIYSHEIPQMMYRLLAPGKAHCLLDWRDYWERGFWADREFRAQAFANTLDTVFAAQFARKMKGWDKASKIFKVMGQPRSRAESTGMGTEGGGSEPIGGNRPFSLFITLRTIDPSPIDTINWQVPVRNGKPTTDWDELITIHEKANDAVSSRIWMLEWKAELPGSSLEINVSQRRCISAGSDLFFMLAWTDGKFAGQPDYEVYFKREQAFGTAYLGTKEDRTLVTLAKQGYGKHWFDQLDVGFDAMRLEYCTVDAEGKPTRQSLLKSE